VAFFAVEAGRRRGLPVSLGAANDLVGSGSSAPVVAGGPAGRPGRGNPLAGLAATVVLTAAGPALVLGWVRFAVQMPVAIGAFEGLAAWLVLTSRAGRGTLPDDVVRLGIRSGAGVLVGGAVAGAGLLLPERSGLRRPALALGGLPGVLGMLAVPTWFLRLGHPAHRSSA